MRLSVKIRSDGSMRIFDLSANSTWAELNTLVGQWIGTQKFQLSHGENKLNAQPDTLLTALDLVSGDRLFLDAENVHINSDAPKMASDTQNVNSSAACSSTKTDSAMDTSTPLPSNKRIVEPNGAPTPPAEPLPQFFSRMTRIMQDHLCQRGFTLESLQSWNSPVTSGKELFFDNHVLGVNSCQLVMILMTSPADESSLTTLAYKVTNSGRHLLSSFMITRRTPATEYMEHLAAVLSHCGSISLEQLMFIRVLRSLMLPFLSGKEGAQLRATSKQLFSLFSSREMDLEFWKKTCIKDFHLTGGLPEGSSTYRSYYFEKAMQMKRNRDAANRLMETDFDYVVPQHLPYFPDANPYPYTPGRPRPNPVGPNPYPLGPDPDPLAPAQPRPPLHDPFPDPLRDNRNPFAPPANPLDPFRGGELLPQRAPRRGGDPFRMPSNNPYGGPFI